MKLCHIQLLFHVLTHRYKSTTNRAQGHDTVTNLEIKNSKNKIFDMSDDDLPEQTQWTVAEPETPPHLTRTHYNSESKSEWSQNTSLINTGTRRMDPRDRPELWESSRTTGSDLQDLKFRHQSRKQRKLHGPDLLHSHSPEANDTSDAIVSQVGSDLVHNITTGTPELSRRNELESRCDAETGSAKSINSVHNHKRSRIIEDNESMWKDFLGCEGFVTPQKQETTLESSLSPETTQSMASSERPSKAINPRKIDSFLDGVKDGKKASNVPRSVTGIPDGALIANANTTSKNATCTCENKPSAIYGIPFMKNNTPLNKPTIGEYAVKKATTRTGVCNVQLGTPQNDSARIKCLVTSTGYTSSQACCCLSTVSLGFLLNRSARDSAKECSRKVARTYTI